MGKKSVSIVFLITLLTSLILFQIRRDPPDNTVHSDDLLKIPRIVLEDFDLNRYELTQIISGTSGKLAYFYEPNIIEVFASFDVFRNPKVGDPERLRSEMARAYLKADSMSELMKMKDMLVSRAEVEDHVRITGNDHLLETDQVGFQGATNSLQSKEVVVAKGPNRIFRGESGFEYKLGNQELRVFGPVTGVFQPNISGASSPASVE